MHHEITWESDLKTGLARAAAEKKCVLLDFFNPGWTGCQQMGAVTYPNPEVVEYVQQNVIPVQVRFDAKPEAEDFNVTWTPTMVVLDETGKEHHRNVGFQAPEEFIPFLMVGQARTAFDLNNFEAAISLLEKVIKDYPKSAAAPEAAFHLGVSRYKATRNAAHLKEAFEFLKANYPGSEWLKRAQPYALL